MTDNEIIKALGKMKFGGHSCLECKHKKVKGDNRCGIKGCRIAQDALGLINRQKAEIEKLKKDKYILKDGNLELLPRTDIDIIKSEAIREFLMEFKKRISFFIPIANVEEKQGVYECLDKLDEVKKEMVGEANE